MNIPTWASGQLRTYARDREIWAALQAQPGFSEAAAVADEAQAMLDTLQAREAELSEGFDVSTMVEYGEIPPSWLDSIAAKAADREALSLQKAAVLELRGAAHSKVQDTVTNSADAILSVLGERMDEVVSRIEEAVKELGTANTPAEAIELGTADAWRKLTEARPEYLRLREAQKTVFVSSGGTWSEPWAHAKVAKADGVAIPGMSYAEVKNLDEIFPKYAYNHEAGYSPFTLDTDYWLVEVVKAGGQLWLPTGKELVAHLAERRRFFSNEYAEATRLFRKNYLEYRTRFDAGEFHPTTQLAMYDLERAY